MVILCLLGFGIWCLWLLSTLLGIESLCQENQTTTFGNQLIIDEQLTAKHTLVVILHWLHMTKFKTQITLWNLTSESGFSHCKFVLVFLNVGTHSLNFGEINIYSKTLAWCLRSCQTVDNL